MTKAEITTEHGTFTGRTPETIVRREYGRDAVIRWSADRNSSQAGMVVRALRDGSGWFLLATLRSFTTTTEHGTFTR